MTNVSRLTITRVDGLGTCYDCGGPVEPNRVRMNSAGEKRPQSKCRRCHLEYQRERRAGKVEVLLTPQEWAAVKRMRQAARGGNR